MASSVDASQPLLGDHNPDLERQESFNSSYYNTTTSNNNKTTYSTSVTHGSGFIGNLSSWSRRGARGLGIGSSDPQQRYYHDYPDNFPHDTQPDSVFSGLRARTRSFLSSKWGHYLILFMVAVDVACIFADFLIELRVCELRERHQTIDRQWGLAQEALGLVGLIFSCLFMVELIASVLSFGLGYFRSKFHTFDALVIVLAFILDVALRGVVEEIGSLVVVLRLWRVFKIIEEMGDISAEMMEKYEEELEALRAENGKLKRDLKGYGWNEEDDVDGNAAGDEEDNNE
jgi:voltage-gated hydrogen channel 1